jgi:PAS domain-containing protein
MDGAQKPLELILARNLLTAISTPALLVDNDGDMLFFNEATAALVGRSFEETGRLAAEEWHRVFGLLPEPTAESEGDAQRFNAEVKAGRPARGEFRIRAADGEEIEVDAAALPLVANGSAPSGAMIMVWPRGRPKTEAS